MSALPGHPPPSLTPPPGRLAVSLEDLGMCVRALDPGSRALLDLSLRRRLPFEAMAGFLQTDPFDLARRRARAVARIAAELDLEGPGVVATVRAALGRLPDDAWGVPLPARREPTPVQAEAMAAAARALMVRLREQRGRAIELAALEAGVGESASVRAEPESPATELARLEVAVGDQATVTAAEPEAQAAPSQEEEATAVEEQPTVESEAIVLEPEVEAPPADASPAAEDQPTVETDALAPWNPTRPPIAVTDMAAAFAYHPAFAVENDEVDTTEVDVAELPSLAEALARAAASERAAAEAAVVAQPDPTPGPAPVAGRPAAPLVVPHAAERAPRRSLARGSILIGVLLAVVRFLLGRR